MSDVIKFVPPAGDDRFREIYDAMAANDAATLQLNWKLSAAGSREFR